LGNCNKKGKMKQNTGRLSVRVDMADRKVNGSERERGGGGLVTFRMFSCASSLMGMQDEWRAEKRGEGVFL
jgi:hypothetical protein